ncbi:MAG: class I SAM-dependent methyltransferase [Dehalococcoidia bacterium]
MTRTDVVNLYSVAGGRWWDPFRVVWELCTSRRAKRDLESLLRRYVTAESTILDVGCGTGTNLGRLLRLEIPFAHYTGVDFSPSMLARARKRFRHLPRLTFREGDATALGDTGERYDLIVATWLLDHVRESAACVNDIQRFLAADGHLLLLFYSKARWFIASWLSPLGGLLVRADPVPEQEISKFSSVVSKKSYCAGAVTLVDIAPSGLAIHNSGGGSD